MEKSGEADSTQEERERVAKVGPVGWLLFSGHDEVGGEWGAWSGRK